jgi:glycosyltransferase involved in cell wall biosynthesis
MTSLPLVTALVPAHDAEAFIAEAVLSALHQDYPADRLGVVVVDDGSRDATAQIVARIAAEHPARVRLVRQENRGLVGAVNAAAAHADGELLALLDADDVWAPDKLRRQVEVLCARPEVALVYGDMTVIDAAGEVLQASWLEGEDPPRGRAIGALLEQNLVTASSVVARAELFPVPDAMPWADWWLAVRAAQVGEVAYLPEPRTFYRYHGANMSLGTEGPARMRELRKGLTLQRWFLRGAEAELIEERDLRRAWAAFERNAREVLSLAGSPFAPLVTVTGQDRAESAALVERACAAPPGAALGAWVRACAADPGSERALAGLRAASDGPIVLAAAEELIAAPALLERWAETMRGVPRLTLAIDATRLADAETAVVGLVDGCGLADDDLDLLALVAPLDAQQSARVRARYAARADAATAPRAFGPDELPALRALVAAA